MCLCVNLFSVNDLSGTTCPRTLKFGTKLGNDKLYCVTKKISHILLISPFICPFFSFSLTKFSVIDFSASN